MATITAPTFRLSQPARSLSQWNYLNVIFFIFIFSLNFEMVNLTGGEGNGISVARIIFPLYLIAFAVNKGVKITGRSLSVAIPALLMLYLAVTSSLFNYDGPRDRIIDWSIVSNIILFLLVASHQERFPKLLMHGMLFFAIGATVAAIMSLMGIGNEFDSDGRLTIFGDNSNLVGLRMSLATTIFAFIIAENLHKKFLVVAMGAASIATFTVMITTGSRVAFVALCVSLAVFIWSRVRSFRTFLLQTIVLVAVSYAMFWALLENDNVLVDRLIKSYVERHTAGRENVWRLYFDSLGGTDSWTFGLGFSGFDDLSRRLFGRILSPHNVLLEVILLSGVVGFGLFLYFNGRAFYSAWRAQREAKFTLPLMLLSPYLGAILTAQTLTNKIMWLILAFCLAPIAASPPKGWMLSFRRGKAD